MSTVPQRPRCPVCGQPTYSRSGAHPQCMQASNDRLVRAASAAAAAAAAASVTVVTPPAPPT
ncbi:MAG: hypothetical protein ACOYK7_14155 [Pirellulales bacterium]